MEYIISKHFLQYQVLVVNDFSNGKDNNFKQVRSGFV